jgi:hypothetical protein
MQYAHIIHFYRQETGRQSKKVRLRDTHTRQLGNLCREHWFIHKKSLVFPSSFAIFLLLQEIKGFPCF